MIIGIQDYYLYGLALLVVFVVMIAALAFKQIKDAAPDAFTHWKAKRAGKPICRVHYRGNICRDYIAEVEPIEKNMGTPYWTISSIGIKFKPGPEDNEFIEGSLRCVNYYENMLLPVKIAYAVAFSQLKDYFAKMGIPIDGVEDIALYAAAQAEKGTKEAAIADAKINSLETRKYIQKYLEAIEKNKAFLEKQPIVSGRFTFQTAMKALDSTIAYTSSNVSHMKEVIRASIMLQNDNDKKNLMQWAIIAVILAIAGVILLIGVYQVMK